MSFSGDLEHLSIIDVIQLLHTTRKSGTLTVRGRRGESQLVFSDGYIVSANHLNSAVRIGKLLVEAGSLTEETLEGALQEQREAGADRKPLIAMLLERGVVDSKTAYRALEALIEMTVVEILTWKTGSFSLDADATAVSDEYRYFPEKLHEEIIINTQNVLMDALRIYDEKRHAGELADEEVFHDDGIPDAGDEGISADILGLSDMDRLERMIPQVFSTLEDRDPKVPHREKLRQLAPNLSEEEREALASFLAVSAPVGENEEQDQTRRVVLYSPDELLRHCLTSVCTGEGIAVFSTGLQEDLDPVLDSFLAKGTPPLLVIERPIEGHVAADEIAALRRRLHESRPQVPVVQLGAPRDYGFTLHAYRDGAATVLPRPLWSEAPEAFIPDTIRFLEAFRGWLRKARGAGPPPLTRLREAMVQMQGLREAPEIALALLRFTGTIFPRAAILVVRPGEVIVERTLGVVEGADPSPALGLHVPTPSESLPAQVAASGEPFAGITGDAAVCTALHGAIGAPREPHVLLAPLRTGGRTVALVYGDCGSGTAPEGMELPAILAQHAGIVLEFALFRKRQASGTASK